MHRQSPCNAPSPMSAGPPPKTSQPGVLDRRGARAWGHEARPPARFSSLSSHRTVNQEQEPWGNTLLAQRTRFAGNSYFWRTARPCAVWFENLCRRPYQQHPHLHRRREETAAVAYTHACAQAEKTRGQMGPAGSTSKVDGRAEKPGFVQVRATRGPNGSRSLN